MEQMRGKAILINDAKHRKAVDIGDRTQNPLTPNTNSAPHRWSVLWDRR